MKDISIGQQVLTFQKLYLHSLYRIFVKILKSTKRDYILG